MAVRASEPRPFRLRLLAFGRLDGESGARVADIFTRREVAPEVAAGRIDEIHVLVPNDDGRCQVAKGDVHSHYELRQPIAERPTDGEWRAMHENGTEPDRPAWQDEFLVSP